MDVRKLKSFVSALISCYCAGLLNQIMVEAESDNTIVLPALLKEAKATVLPEPSIGIMAR